eukprot:scaffold182436_cov23-Tisochrysis_lutea.AAC.1
MTELCKALQPAFPLVPCMHVAAPLNEQALHASGMVEGSEEPGVFIWTKALECFCLIPMEAILCCCRPMR